MKRSGAVLAVRERRARGRKKRGESDAAVECEVGIRDPFAQAGGIESHQLAWVNAAIAHDELA
jgi:hypothetical protein